MNLPSFDSFSLDDTSSAGPRWRKYLARFEVLITALNLQNQAVRKRALLLHYAGEQVYEIFETFTDAQKGGDDEDGYKTLKASFTAYFEPRRNIDYERFMFRQAKQDQGETTDSYCKRLRRLCEFANVEQELKGQVL